MKKKFKPLNKQLEDESKETAFKTQWKYHAGIMTSILRSEGKTTEEGLPLNAKKTWYRQNIDNWLDAYIERNKEAWGREEASKMLDKID